MTVQLHIGSNIFYTRLEFHLSCKSGFIESIIILGVSFKVEKFATLIDGKRDCKEPFKKRLQRRAAFTSAHVRVHEEAISILTNKIEP